MSEDISRRKALRLLFGGGATLALQGCAGGLLKVRQYNKDKEIPPQNACEQDVVDQTQLLRDKYGSILGIYPEKIETPVRAKFYLEDLLVAGPKIEKDDWETAENLNKRLYYNKGNGGRFAVFAENKDADGKPFPAISCYD